MPADNTGRNAPSGHDTGMDIMQLVERTRDLVTVKRAFGEPIAYGDVTIIPVAKILGGGCGGGGGGGGDAGDGLPGYGSGGGGGGGFQAIPLGVFVVKDGDARWQPTVDVNRVILGGQLVAVVALFTVRAIVRSRAKARSRQAKAKRHDDAAPQPAQT